MYLKKELSAQIIYNNDCLYSRQLRSENVTKYLEEKMCVCKITEIMNINMFVRRGELAFEHILIDNAALVKRFIND